MQFIAPATAQPDAPGNLLFYRRFSGLEFACSSRRLSAILTYMTPRAVLDPRPANSSDYTSVAVCFEDPVINHLFAELLQVHGVNTEIIWDIRDLKGGTKIITEPQYFASLPSSCRQKCLLVGDPDVLEEFEAPGLSRPLTEEKIDRALCEFLKFS